MYLTYSCNKRNYKVRFSVSADNDISQMVITDLDTGALVSNHEIPIQVLSDMYTDMENFVKDMAYHESN